MVSSAKGARGGRCRGPSGCAPRAGNLLRSASDVAGVQGFIRTELKFTREVKPRPRRRVAFTEAGQSFFGGEESIEGINVVVGGSEPPPLLQPSGHWPGIGLVGVAIHPGVKVLDRIGEQIKTARFKPKSSGRGPFAVDWRVEEANSCLGLLLTLAKGVAGVRIDLRPVRGLPG